MSQTQVFSIRILAEVSIIAALAMALSYIPLEIRWIEISLGTVLIILISLRHGTLIGLMTGFIWGLLHFALGKVYFLSVPQVLIEYVLAFTFSGFAGLAQKPFAKTGRNCYIILAVIIGVFAKYFWHFIAGVIFWSDYAWKGWGAVSYSLVINGTSAILTGLVAAILLITIKKAYPKLFNC
ncbi:energy-coupled thiamine transporter ThiT [Pseudolactococcus yaeyamensis]